MCGKRGELAPCFLVTENGTVFLNIFWSAALFL
jgi:hypothetical protein